MTTRTLVVVGAGVAALRGSGRVEEVVLDDGRTEAADVVVAGIGVAPRVELAATAGLAVDNGIVVDEHLETGARALHRAAVLLLRPVRPGDGVRRPRGR